MAVLQRLSAELPRKRQREVNCLLQILLHRPSDEGIKRLESSEVFCVLCVDGYIARLRKTESDEQASQNVTEGLMELRQIMQGQLQHSHTTMEVLGED